MSSFKLTPGVAYHLQPDGYWKVSEIPKSDLDAEFSGHLTIKGDRCLVFETPSGDQWAQKSIVSPELPQTPSKLASKLRRVASLVDVGLLTPRSASFVISVLVKKIG